MWGKGIPFGKSKWEVYNKESKILYPFILRNIRESGMYFLSYDVCTKMWNEKSKLLYTGLLIWFLYMSLRGIRKNSTYREVTHLYDTKWFCQRIVSFTHNG